MEPKWCAADRTAPCARAGEGMTTIEFPTASRMGARMVGAALRAGTP